MKFFQMIFWASVYAFGWFYVGPILWRWPVDKSSLTLPYIIGYVLTLSFWFLVLKYFHRLSSR